jgi:hypothetical protein
MILYGHRLKNHKNYLSVVSGSYYSKIVCNPTRPKYYDFFEFDKLTHTNKSKFESLLPCNLEGETISKNELSFEEKVFYNLHQLILNFVADKDIDIKTPWWTIDESFTKHTERIVYDSYIENFNKLNNYV